MNQRPQKTTENGSRQHWNSIWDFIRKKSGIDLQGYSQDVCLRGLTRRMEALGMDSVEDYWVNLVKDPEESLRLIDTVAVRHSSFFRDPLIFETIADQALPERLERRRKEGRRVFRAWSAGCAGGQEAFSLAILVHQALGRDFDAWRVNIFATDVAFQFSADSDRMFFPGNELEDVRLGVLSRYFIPSQDGYEIAPIIRNVVRFSADNLLSPERFAPAESVFGSFDFVLCRNVLIYFSQLAQVAVLERLVRSLDRGGFLVLGRNDSLDQAFSNRLVVQDERNRIFKKL